MTDRQRKIILDAVDALLDDTGMALRDPVLLTLLGLLEVGPDVQEDGE